MTSSHPKPDAVQSFTGRTNAYIEYREHYDPNILLPRLQNYCGLTPEWIIADIGAGTGMLSDIFVENGNRVKAIEPNAEMRETFAAFHAGDARLELVDGTAEATPLSDCSIDLISMGRSFHWFNIDLAMKEFRRILKPDGWILSVTLGRNKHGGKANTEIESMLDSFTADNLENQRSYAKYDRLRELLGRDYCHEIVEGEMRLTEEELFGFLRSISRTPLPNDSRFPELQRKTEEIFARHAVHGCITLPTQCSINLGRLR